MAERPNKVILIGLDSPIVPRLYRFCKEGHLPTINKLFVEGGVWANNCLVPLPTVTPPNWAAITTGCWPSTLEITDFNIHVPGDELDWSYQGHFSDAVHAETIYEALARAGKKTILLNYPSTWPPKVEDSIVIGGNGLSINTWSLRRPFTGLGLDRFKEELEKTPASEITYAGARLYSTQAYPDSTRIEFGEPADWKDLPDSGDALVAEMPLAFPQAKYRLQPVTWYILLREGRVTVCENKHVSAALATLGEGKWSPVITREFQTEIGPKKAVFRMKLLECSEDGEQFRLLMTNIGAVDGWSHPASIAAEIKSTEGLPGPGFSWGGQGRGWYGLDTVAEIEDMEHVFFADAATYLLKNKPWNLYMMHAHAPDHMYHAICNALNNPDPAVRKPHEELELAIYKSLDQMCARIFGCADQNTVLAMVSDHGAKPSTKPFRANPLLQQAGFLSRDANRVVDWSKTKAFGPGAAHIFINVKGRDPHGIVAPGDEYRRVQDELIEFLYNYTDPVNGKKPVVFALRKEDARMIGIHGDYAGDVIYGLGGEYGGQHSPQVPTTTYGMGDLRGLLLLSGPNIKKGVMLERTVWIQDLVPTLCYLTGWPVPAQAEGAIIYQALENPDT